ncbi:hypothetical protein PIB30_083764, partial [Stylosanthes scabra]|nr:hypothetical protein [Stylosanthes scabra]
LEGKVALITGGAGGLGECMAKLFCKHGAKVLIADIRDQQGLAVQDAIGAQFATYVHCDVTKETDVENAVNLAISKYQKLDILINNAAVIDYTSHSIINDDVSEFERVLRVNITGPFLGTKHAARVMIPARKGSIVNVGSVSSSVGGVATHAYTSSKHGLVGLTKNVAAELGKFGIRVNCLSPYFVANDSGKEFFKLDGEGCSNVYSNLKGVHLQAEDVAQAALYLVVMSPNPFTTLLNSNGSFEKNTTSPTKSYSTAYPASSSSTAPTPSPAFHSNSLTTSPMPSSAASVSIHPPPLNFSELPPTTKPIALTSDPTASSPTFLREPECTLKRGRFCTSSFLYTARTITGCSQFGTR